MPRWTCFFGASRAGSDALNSGSIESAHCLYMIANMLFRVDASSGASLADQIAAQVRASVISGELAAGERLPSARELATSLRVNVHTVLRAYGTLRDEGVIQMRQGRGAWVSATAGAELISMNELVAQLMAHARKLGMNAADVVRLVERA